MQLLASLGTLILASCVRPNNQSQVKNLSLSTYEGVATYFDAHGLPYRACGVPEKNLDSPYFVALNVQHTPGEYKVHSQPPIENEAIIGAWENGLNCGRWVRVTIGDFCEDKGKIHGKTGLCPEKLWMKDQYNGKTKDFVVSDSCQDGNIWCRDSRYHLDIATASLDKFAAGLKDKWNNRKISWHYIKSPNYSGDIRIAFRQNAKPSWPAIIITHLENGIRGVEQDIDGQFKPIKMDSDMGQSYVLKDRPNRRYRIQVRDADLQLINGGRIYEFSLPCSTDCKEAFNEVKYKVTDGVEASQVSPSQRTPEQRKPATQTPVTPQTQTTKPSAPLTTPQADSGPKATVMGEIRISSEWPGGLCADLIIANNSGEKINSWIVSVRTGGAAISQSWGLKVTPSADGFVGEPSESWNAAVDSTGRISNQGFCLNYVSTQPALVSASAR